MSKQSKSTAVTTAMPSTVRWSSNMKEELSKLRQLMQIQFAEVAKDPQYDPSLVLVNEGDYGGIRNKFILCREVDGKIFSLDSETELKHPVKLPDVENQSENDPNKPLLNLLLTKPIVDSSAKTAQAPGTFTAMTQNPFLTEGIRHLNASQYPYENKPRVIPSLNQARFALKKSLVMPTLISVVTPKGKRIDFNNNDILALQQKADGHGKLTMVYGDENVEFDVKLIMENVKKGIKAMLIPNTDNFFQPGKSQTAQKRSAEKQVAKKMKM